MTLTPRQRIAFSCILFLAGAVVLSACGVAGDAAPKGHDWPQWGGPQRYAVWRGRMNAR